MANLYGGNAFDALNEEAYINQLYGSNNESEKKLIDENYKDNVGLLDTEQNRVQQQTQENLERTQVEAESAQQKYSGPKLTLGASQQEALNRENAQRNNLSSLEQNRNEIDAEIERQRQLLASQYESAIKQAQAENDMAKAQMLYDAAKRDEEKLNALRMEAYEYMSQSGDYDIETLSVLLSGSGSGSRGSGGGGSFGGNGGAGSSGMNNDGGKYGNHGSFGRSGKEGQFGKSDKGDQNGSSGKYWSETMKNEADINKIYDSELEALRIGIESDWEKALSDLLAKQLERQKQTDTNLTKAYVDGLQKMKNYSEVQSAYGQGSGTAGAARIAQDTELQEDLTKLRLGQMDADAKFGTDRLGIGTSFTEELVKAVRDSNAKRTKALLEAAEKEEDMLIEQQYLLAQALAEEDDFSLLARLLGVPVSIFEGSESSSGGGSSGGSSSSSGKEPTIIEKANVAYHAGEDMTKHLESQSSGGKLAGGNLTDYLAIYT